MEKIDPKELKDRIKLLAKKRGKLLKDIQKMWGLSPPGLDKRIESPNFPYSKHVHELAEFLKCSIEDIIGKKEFKLEVGVCESEVKEPVVLYHNGQRLDDAVLIHVLKSENLLLQQIINKQQAEIEFYREQISNKH